MGGRTVNALGRRTTTNYDAANRTRATIDPLNNRTSSVYDAVDGRPDLQMIVYNPATPADQEQIRSLIEGALVIAAE